MKKRVIPPPGIDPVFVPLAYEVPRPFSSSLVQRVQGFFCTKRAPVWWKRLPELFNWLRVLGTAESSQVDQRVCQQLHAIVSLLDAFKAEQQPLEFVLPGKGALDAHA